MSTQVNNGSDPSIVTHVSSRPLISFCQKRVVKKKNPFPLFEVNGSSFAHVVWISNSTPNDRRWSTAKDDPLLDDFFATHGYAMTHLSVVCLCVYGTPVVGSNWPNFLAVSNNKDSFKKFIRITVGEVNSKFFKQTISQMLPLCSKRYPKHQCDYQITDISRTT